MTGTRTTYTTANTAAVAEQRGRRDLAAQNLTADAIIEGPTPHKPRGADVTLWVTRWAVTRTAADLNVVAALRTAQVTVGR